MPTQDEIHRELAQVQAAAQDNLRRRYIRQLSEHTKRNTIVYASAFTSNKLPGAPSLAVSITLQDLQGFMSALHGMKGNDLDLVLHSPGGSLEAADQIVQYLRQKFTHIRAIVPQNAMSAATMLACACDEILMGKHSALGPIDPQIAVPTTAGAFIAPAHAILADFRAAADEIKADPRSAPMWIGKLNSYPIGFLTKCQDTIALAENKVAEWLASYMLREQHDADAKARKIAQWLGDAANHKTHARPIMAKQAAEIGLSISRLEDNQALQEHVLSVFHAVNLTFETTNCVKMVENQNGKGWFVQLDYIPARVTT